MKKIEKKLKFFFKCLSSDFCEVVSCGTSEGEVPTLTIKMRYEYACAFSTLPLRQRKEGLLARELIFQIGRTYDFKIFHDTSQHEVIFKIDSSKKSDSIEFQMQNTAGTKADVWSVKKTEIRPKAALTPWYYKTEFVKLRQIVGTSLPLSQIISFYHSRDFGLDELEASKEFQKKKSRLTFGDFEQLFKNSMVMDFSDFLKERKTEYYKNCLTEIKSYQIRKKGKDGDINRLLTYNLIPENQIDSLLAQNILKDEKKVLEIIENHFPFSNKLFCFEVLNRKFANISKFPPPRMDAMLITPASIDGDLHLLNTFPSHTDEDASLNSSVVSQDIVIVSGDYGFGRLAIVDMDNCGRPISNDVKILGRATVDDYDFWSLLRTKYIKRQIQACCDPNLKKICHQTVFDNTYINHMTPFDKRLNKLTFSLAKLLSKREFDQNKFACVFLGNELDTLIKDNLSTARTVNFSLRQKTKTLIRAGAVNSIRQCLVIHTNSTKKIATSIKKNASTKNHYFNIEDIKNKIASRKILYELCDVDFAVISLTLDSIYELELARSIIRVMGRNHLVLQCEEWDSQRKPLSLQDCISCLNTTNYRFVRNRNEGTEIIQHISSIIYREGFLNDIFRDLLIQFSELSIDSFKRVPCNGTSTAMRKRTAKELEIFTNIQKPLIHLSYTFKTIFSNMNYDIYLLQEAEKLVELISYSDLDVKWKQFQKNYNTFIRKRTLGAFVKEHEQIVIDLKESLPKLYEIHKYGMKKYKKNGENLQKSCIASINQLFGEETNSHTDFNTFLNDFKTSEFNGERPDAKLADQNPQTIS